MDANRQEQSSNTTSEENYPSALPAATNPSSSAEGSGDTGGVALPPQTPSLTAGNLALLTLQAENRALLERLALSDAACKTLSSRLATSEAVNKTLATKVAAAEATTTTLEASIASKTAELLEARRTLSLVRKSDRRKNEHERTNLKLKALVNGHDCGKPSMEAVRTEMKLREGLAYAKRRVEELEHVGRTLLDALERDSDSDTSSEEDGEEEEEAEEDEDGQGRPGVAEAQALFWRVVEDEESAGQKEKWEGILKGKGV